MRRRLVFVLAIGIGVVVTFACNRPAPQAPAPTQAAPLLELSLSGFPRPIVVGDLFQLKATALLTDHSVTDVTSRVTWETSNAAIASVSATGFVTTRQAGDVRISATYQNQTDTASVQVKSPPPGS